ncbi:MAG: hypothetical protein GF350_06475 [Chitinivibrionales bacterium]|nr:hypothetical protein [Chitinivibrionales bacterium]
MKSFKFLAVFLLSQSLFFAAFAESKDDDTTEQKIEASFSGGSNVHIGQIHKAYAPEEFEGGNILHSTKFLTKKVMTSWDINFNLELEFNERMKVFAGAGGAVSFDLHAGPTEFIGSQGPGINKARGGFFGIYNTYLKYDLGNIENPPLSLHAGYFPYIYSQNSKTFGNYMYRTQLYPCLIYEGFPSVLGIRASSTLFESLKQDIIFSSETEKYPFFDFSLTYIASYTIFNTFEIGVGGSLWRILPIQESFTTPFSDKSRREKKLTEWALTTDSTTRANIEKYFYIEDGDTTYYTFAGQKLMARFNFDPKGFIKSDIFGENDLELYGEAILLGIKNDTRYYKEIRERIPVMIGFNFPTFKLLDVLAVEFEYYEWPHSTSIQDIDWAGYPVPSDIVESFGLIGTPEKVESLKRKYKEHDNFKFAVHAHRSIGKHLGIGCKFARDHTRLPDWNGNPEWEENFALPEHWYYLFTMSYSFK